MRARRLLPLVGLLSGCSLLDPEKKATVAWDQSTYTIVLTADGTSAVSVPTPRVVIHRGSDPWFNPVPLSLHPRSCSDPSVPVAIFTGLSTTTVADVYSDSVVFTPQFTACEAGPGPTAATSVYRRGTNTIKASMGSATDTMTATVVVR